MIFNVISFHTYCDQEYDGIPHPSTSNTATISDPAAPQSKAVKGSSFTDKELVALLDVPPHLVGSVTTRYGLQHYDYLIRRTGPFIFLSTYLI